MGFGLSKASRTPHAPAEAADVNRKTEKVRKTHSNFLRAH